MTKTKILTNAKHEELKQKLEYEHILKVNEYAVDSARNKSGYDGEFSMRTKVDFIKSTTVNETGKTSCITPHCELTVSFNQPAVNEDEEDARELFVEKLTTLSESLFTSIKL